MTYAEQLKKIRKSLTLSQVEMAEKLDITQSYYSALERGAKEISSHLITKLIEDFNVSPDWFYSSNGSIFRDVGEKNGKGTNIERIGVLRQKTYESLLSKEDQQLIASLRELPELAKMLVNFTFIISIGELEDLSSNGAAWVPGGIWDKTTYFSKDLKNEAYEHNMATLLKFLTIYKPAIIDFKKSLYSFLKTIKPLDRNNEIKLPIE